MHLFNRFTIKFLNPFKAFFAFVYLRPRKFIRELISKRSLSGFADLLFNPAQPDELKAFSAAFGVFMGIIPIWGFQTLAAIFLAVTLKLNKPLVVVFSLVSFPLMPLIIFLSYRIGHYWTGNNGSDKNIVKHLEQYIYGSATLAFAAAIVIGLMTFLLLKLIKNVKKYNLATSRDHSF